MLVNCNCDNINEDHFEELSKTSVFTLNWWWIIFLFIVIMILYTLHIDYNYSLIAIQHLITV